MSNINTSVILDPVEIITVLPILMLSCVCSVCLGSSYVAVSLQRQKKNLVQANRFYDHISINILLMFGQTINEMLKTSVTEAFTFILTIFRQMIYYETVLFQVYLYMHNN